MAKPILIIEMPDGAHPYFDKIQKQVRKQVQNEYHVLVVGQPREDIGFMVLNAENQPEIKYSELKKLIKNETQEA